MLLSRNLMIGTKALQQSSEDKEAMLEKGIFCDSFSWSVNVEYVPRSDEDE